MAERYQRMLHMLNDAIVEVSSTSPPLPKLAAVLGESRDQMVAMPFTSDDYRDMQQVLREVRSRAEASVNWQKRAQWLIPLWGALLTTVNLAVVMFGLYIGGKL